MTGEEQERQAFQPAWLMRPRCECLSFNRLRRVHTPSRLDKNDGPHDCLRHASLLLIEDTKHDARNTKGI